MDILQATEQKQVFYLTATTRGQKSASVYISITENPCTFPVTKKAGQD